MNIICTSIEQSKILAEFLPLESADICYLHENGQAKMMSPSKLSEILNVSKPQVIPCWSLAALFDVLPKGTRFLKSTTDDTYHCDCPKGNIDKWFDNPVDACVEMIIKLHELNLL